MKKGKAIIFSAPSGSGKTTIVKHLVGKFDFLCFSISACSREKRGNEQNGKDYYFLSIDEFKAKIANQEFVEWEEVYSSSFYGTLKSEIERIWTNNQHVIFDVDVNGGLKLKKFFKENALSVFVKIPDLNTLEQRLRGRKTDTEEKVQQRLAKAKEETKQMPNFDIVLENVDLQTTLKNAEKLILDFTQ